MSDADPRDRPEPAEPSFALDPEAMEGGPAAEGATPVVLRIYDAPFRAHADRVVLEEAGIDCRVIDAVSGGIGLGRGGGRINRVELIVRERDRGEAARLLEDNRRDSVDIDWDEVDVGEPADAVSAEIARRPPGDPGASRAMPMPARVGWAIAALLLVTMILLSLVGAFP